MASMDTTTGDENLPPPNHSWSENPICQTGSRSPLTVRSVLSNLNVSATETMKIPTETVSVSYFTFTHFILF